MSRVHRTTRLSGSKTDPGVVFSVKLTNAHENNHKNERVSIVRTCRLSRARAFLIKKAKSPATVNSEAMYIGSIWFLYGFYFYQTSTKALS